MLAAIEARISREALPQRLTAPAAAFLCRCLHGMLGQKLQTAAIGTELLRPVGRVLLVDSSSWAVSEKLREVLPGSGGSASKANCKIQTAYEYKKGELVFLDDTAGTVPDNRSTDQLPALLNTRDLLLIDHGYFKRTTFIAIIDKGAFFLTRFLIGTTLQDVQTMAPIELGSVLSHCRESIHERAVPMGQGKTQTSPCRLVCFRVSEQVANERRRRFKQQARKKGRAVSPRHLALCDWTLLVINVPEKWLPLDRVRALYTLRWQSEVRFKPFKSILQVHQANTGKAHRLRCELYGQLMAAVVVPRMHAVANTALWHAVRKEISMDKWYKRIHERAFNLAQRCVLSFAQAMAHLYRERATLLKHCRKYRQRSRMTTRDRLEAGFDPNLPTNKCQCLA